MGLGIKHFIFDEQTGGLYKLSGTDIQKLHNGESLSSLKEYSGKILKYINVIVENRNRKAVEIVDMQFPTMKLDKNGKIDKTYQLEQERAAMSILASVIPPFNKPDNVIEADPDMAGKKYRNQFNWNPPQGLIQKIKNIILK